MKIYGFNIFGYDMLKYFLFFFQMSKTFLTCSKIAMEEHLYRPIVLVTAFKKTS